MLRFAIKTGIAAGAIYYVKKEGVWKDSNESLKCYNKLNATFGPYMKEVRKQIPIELPEIPDSERRSQSIKLYWNKGVLVTFRFLKDLPSNINTWVGDGTTAILENPDVKKLFGQSNDGASN